jgi:transcriptional regulator with XRE-family HTH domain
MITTIGQAIADYRAEHGMSYRAMAKATGLPYRSLHHWESGENDPTLTAFRTLVRLGIVPPDAVPGGAAVNPDARL